MENMTYFLTSPIAFSDILIFVDQGVQDLLNGCLHKQSAALEA